MKPCLSQVCSLNSSFETDVADYAAGQCPAIEVWLTKLETYLQTHTIDDARDLLEKHQVSTPVASFQGGLLTSQGERRKQAWQLFDQRLDLCQKMGIGILIVAADMGKPLHQEEIERMRMSLEHVAQQAGPRQLRVALEFQARAAFCNNLQTAAALIAEVGSPHLGLCLDLFHFYIGPSKHEDLAHLSGDNLFHVQLADLADVPRELATDSDRILPGDGDIKLDSIMQHLRHMKYDGHVSIELMNPQIWQINPRQFGEVGMAALDKVMRKEAEGGRLKVEG